MALVQAVVQEGWREILARVHSLDAPEAFAEIARFKLGEGGFVDIPPKEPITPDPTFLDLQSEGAALPGGGTATFTNLNGAVVGVGTSFLADVSPGDWIKPGPEFLVEGLVPNSSGDVGTEVDDWAEVALVVDNLNITLVVPYIGATVTRVVRKASEPLFTFRKTLTVADVLFTSAVPAITEITAIALAGEGNLDQLGNNPIYFELGVFDQNNVMMIYMTFPLETKTPAIQLNHVLELVF